MPAEESSFWLLIVDLNWVRSLLAMLSLLFE